VLMTLIFAAVSMLAFVVSPLWEQLGGLRQYVPTILLYLLLFWIAGGLVFAGTLNLTGRMCLKRFGRLRVSLLLPLWLWVMWLVVGGLLGAAETLLAGERFEWRELLVGATILALVSFVVLLPFLILSFTGSFYRERLKDLLRLPTSVAQPPVATPAPATEQQSPR
jgi:hypothetical protein